MTARTELVALLTGHLPTDVVVIPYARGIDPPAKSTVMVRIDAVRPSKAAQGLQDYEFALVCIAAKTEAGAGDDELDALLEDVLFSVVQLSPAGVTWSEARRATYEESNPAYEVSCVVTVNKT